MSGRPCVWSSEVVHGRWFREGTLGQGCLAPHPAPITIGRLCDRGQVALTFWASVSLCKMGIMIVATSDLL